MNLLLLSLLLTAAHAQQSYVANHQLDCYNTSFNNSTLGYLCNYNSSSSCQSYLTFRSISLCNTPSSIAYLLSSAFPSALAALNNISYVDPIPLDNPILVPVTCSCTSNLSQHNSTYILKTKADTYFGIANNTFQGLTTCQSLMQQNSFSDRNFTVGEVISVPLRCACPTDAQVAAGVKYLLTYLVEMGDSISALSQRFGVDQAELLAANELAVADIIYQFTPLLVPLKTKPSSLLMQEAVTSPPPSSPPPPL